MSILCPLSIWMSTKKCRTKKLMFESYCKQIEWSTWMLRAITLFWRIFYCHSVINKFVGFDADGSRNSEVLFLTCSIPWRRVWRMKNDCTGVNTKIKMVSLYIPSMQRCYFRTLILNILITCESGDFLYTWA